MGKGGGGSAQPTQSTSYTTNLPEYAKPYVMNMLGAAQNQLFTTSPGTTNADGTTTPGEITGFKPYTPYSNDPTQYFAGPSSLQQSVYNQAGQMQTPGQFGQATGLAGAAGMGQLGTIGQAGMYGQQGSTFGGLGTALGAAGAMQAMPAFSAGQQYAQQVTDPRAYSAYMSPYQQQVTDVAKMNAVREAQIAGQQANLGAARQGTYGGARQALMSAEREKNLLGNLSNIQAQGSQAAYDKAMQAQQFGANLGLQGIQTGLQGVQQGLAGTAQGMQGAGLGLQGVGAQQAGYAGAGQAASTLGQLGGAQQQADLARMGFQQQTGQAQQAYQQNIINQAIQDYATAQQYPYMQLSTMSNLLRGLPMQGMSTQQYQAQPSTTQQLLGLAGTGASLYGAMGRKEGGTIKEYAKGGSVGLGYANRGVVDSMRDRLETMAETNPQGLKKLIAQSSSKEVKDMGKEILSGIALGDAGELGRNMAGGGIIAFGDGGDVPGFYEGELIDGFGTNPEAMAMDQMRVADMQLAQKRKRYEDVKAMSPVAAERMLANDPSLEAKPVVAPAAAPVAKKDDALPPGAPPAAAPVNTGDQKSGVAKFLADQDAALAARGVTPGMGEETRGLMDYIKEGKQRRESEAGKDRYLRMAEAFAQFGSTAGPFMSSASKALGGFAKGEAGAQKELRAADFADKKMTADIEKGQRAEARGDYATAQKAYDSAANREVQREGHLKSAEASMYGADREQRMVERAMADPEFMKTMQAMKGNDNVTVQAIKAQLADIGQQIMMAGKDEALKKKLMDQRAALNTRLGEIAKVNDTAPASAQEIKVVSNEAEYAKLKKGQQYRDPNGEIRTKG
jgi:hypothetical protein